MSYSFKRKRFPIRLNEQADKDYDVMLGWESKEIEGIGLYKRNTYWIATDLDSGMKICNGSTRNECMNWIVENMERIEERREEPFYIWRVNEFREILKEGLK